MAQEYSFGFFLANERNNLCLEKSHWGICRNGDEIRLGLAVPRVVSRAEPEEVSAWRVYEEMEGRRERAQKTLIRLRP